MHYGQPNILNLNLDNPSLLLFCLTLSFQNGPHVSAGEIWNLLSKLSGLLNHPKSSDSSLVVGRANFRSGWASCIPFWSWHQSLVISWVWMGASELTCKWPVPSTHPSLGLKTPGCTWPPKKTALWRSWNIQVPVYHKKCRDGGGVVNSLLETPDYNRWKDMLQVSGIIEKAKYSVYLGVKKITLAYFQKLTFP